MERPGWSNKQLRRLGEHIRDGTQPSKDLPAYEEVMLWFNDLATFVQRETRALTWEPLLGTLRPNITSRPKTIDTLRQKLQRDHNTPLPSVQDVAGVRFEAEMSLDEQDAVVHAIAARFDVPPEKIKDLRGDGDAHSGYRAVHLWLNLSGLGRVEVQVRTHLQGMWANVYEAFADIAGREIRYGVIPSDPAVARVVERMQKISTTRIAEMEKTRNGLFKLDLRLDDLEQRRLPVDDLESQQLRALRPSVDEARARIAEDEAEIRRDFEDLQAILRQPLSTRAE